MLLSTEPSLPSPGSRFAAVKSAFAVECFHAFLLLQLAERKESLSLGILPKGILELQSIQPEQEKKQQKKETNYHCLQIKTRKYTQGVVKLLLEASNETEQIQTIQHWANAQAHLLTTKEDTVTAW